MLTGDMSLLLQFSKWNKTRQIRFQYLIISVAHEDSHRTNSGLMGVGGFIELSALPADIQESFRTYGTTMTFWRKLVFRMFHVLATP